MKSMLKVILGAALAVASFAPTTAHATPYSVTGTLQAVRINTSTGTTTYGYAGYVTVLLNGGGGNNFYWGYSGCSSFSAPTTSQLDLMTQALVNGRQVDVYGDGACFLGISVH